MPKECPLCSCETNELINIEKHGVYIANPDGSVGERVTEVCPDCWKYEFSEGKEE